MSISNAPNLTPTALIYNIPATRGARLIGVSHQPVPPARQPALGLFGPPVTDFGAPRKARLRASLHSCKQARRVSVSLPTAWLPPPLERQKKTNNRRKRTSCNKSQHRLCARWDWESCPPHSHSPRQTIVVCCAQCCTQCPVLWGAVCKIIHKFILYL